MATTTKTAPATTTKIASAGAVDNRRGIKAAAENESKDTKAKIGKVDQANLIENLVSGIRQVGHLTESIRQLVDLAVKAKSLAKGIGGTATNLHKAFPEAGWMEVVNALKSGAGKKSAESIFNRVCKEKGIKAKTKGPGFGPANVLALLKGLKGENTPEDFDAAAWRAEMVEAIDAFIEENA